DHRSGRAAAARPGGVRAASRPGHRPGLHPLRAAVLPGVPARGGRGLPVRRLRPRGRPGRPPRGDARRGAHGDAPARRARAHRRQPAGVRRHRGAGREHRRQLPFRAVPDLRADPRRGDRRRVVAAGHLGVPALRAAAHRVQHARPVDARAGRGGAARPHAVPRRLLPRHARRSRRGAAAAARTEPGGRRVGRRVRDHGRPARRPAAPAPTGQPGRRADRGEPGARLRRPRYLVGGPRRRARGRRGRHGGAAVGARPQPRARAGGRPGRPGRAGPGHDRRRRGAL
ncbi:MAG: FIG056164: rhomboid family serine protease, partial [uncultured Pseudonocardia sp.]